MVFTCHRYNTPIADCQSGNNPSSKVQIKSCSSSMASSTRSCTSSLQNLLPPAPVPFRSESIWHRKVFAAAFYKEGKPAPLLVGQSPRTAGNALDKAILLLSPTTSPFLLSLSALSEPYLVLVNPVFILAQSIRIVKAVFTASPGYSLPNRNSVSFH